MKGCILPALALVLLVGCSSTSQLEVVSGFNLNRYLGTWYEAARYPHRFEKDLSAVSAEYSVNDDGTIRVANRGFNDTKQKWENIEGVARLKGAEDQGWLKVSFFKPFYAAYKIIHLDEAYTQAIVAGPSYNYLWILVRDPALPKTELEKLIQRAEQFGYNRTRIQIVDQFRNQPQ